MGLFLAVAGLFCLKCASVQITINSDAKIRSPHPELTSFEYQYGILASITGNRDIFCE